MMIEALFGDKMQNVKRQAEFDIIFFKRDDEL